MMLFVVLGRKVSLFNEECDLIEERIKNSTKISEIKDITDDIKVINVKMSERLSELVILTRNKLMEI